MGLADPDFWLAAGSSAALFAAVFRPVQNIVIAYLALRGAKPRERAAIIEALARTRQFGTMAEAAAPRGAGITRSAVMPVPQGSVDGEGIQVGVAGGGGADGVGAGGQGHR